MVPALQGYSGVSTQSKGRVSHLPELSVLLSPPSNYSLGPKVKATLGKIY